MRLSKDQIEREIMATTVEQDLAAKALQQHQEATNPKRSSIVEKPWGADRWNGVKGGPAGLKKN